MQFIEGMRTPCWKEGDDLFCLPAFFVAGFPKAGTTDVWDKISQHPDVVPVDKEPHLWTRKRFYGRLSALYVG